MNQLLLFDGNTFDRKLDAERLTSQSKKVFELMSDGTWRTLNQIHNSTGYPESSISARIRDFRKPRFGCHQVNRRRKTPGTFEYQLKLNK